MRYRLALEMRQEKKSRLFLILPVRIPVVSVLWFTLHGSLPFPES